MASSSSSSSSSSNSATKEEIEEMESRAKDMLKNDPKVAKLDAHLTETIKNEFYRRMKRSLESMSAAENSLDAVRVLSATKNTFKAMITDLIRVATQASDIAEAKKTNDSYIVA
jgi:molecular chaperone DnaK (HSP70)